MPVIVVNLDQGTLGNALVEVFKSPDLSELLAVDETSDAAAARLRLEADEAAAVVIIPAGFSAQRHPAGWAGSPAAAQIEVYKNPSREVGAGVVESIVERLLTEVETGRVGGQVTVAQLITSGLVPPEQAAQAGLEIGTRLANEGASLQTLTLNTGQVSASAEPSFLMFIAPGFAFCF